MVRKRVFLLVLSEKVCWGKMFRMMSICQNEIFRNCVTVLRHVIARRDRMRSDSAKTVRFKVKSVMEENV